MSWKLAWLAPLFALFLSARAFGTAQENEVFSIQFVDALGVPIPGLSLELTDVELGDSLRPTPRATPSGRETDEEGRIALPLRAKSKHLLLVALERGPHAGHLQLQKEVPWDGQAGNATVRLTRPGTFACQVGGPGPFNDVAVRFFAPTTSALDGLLGGPAGATIRCQPAADGTVLCEGISPGTYTVVLYRGVQEARAEVTIVSGELSERATLEPKGPGAWVSGVLKSSSGDPLPGIPLRLHRDSKFPYNEKNDVVEERIETDRAGRFRFGPVTNGHFYVRPVQGGGPLDLPPVLCSEATTLLMVNDKDVQVDVTISAAERPLHFHLLLHDEDVQQGSGEIRSATTNFSSPFKTDAAGLLHLAIPVAEPGPLAVMVNDGRGTVSTWQMLDATASRMDLAAGRSALHINLGEGVDLGPETPLRYELFRCDEGLPAVSIVKAKAHRSNLHPKSLVRFVGLPEGRYVAVGRNSNKETHRFDFTVKDPRNVEWTLQDLEPCPLTLRVDGRSIDAKGARVARFGLATDYCEHTPPGTYEVLLGSPRATNQDPLLAMGQVTLRRGAPSEANLKQLRPGSVTIEGRDPDTPLPKSLTLVHQLGYRFHPQRIALNPDDPSAPYIAKGLPPGKYEVRSHWNLITSFELAEGDEARIKL